jgi:hypothetical protein
MDRMNEIGSAAAIQPWLYHPKVEKQMRLAASVRKAKWISARLS